MLRLALYLLLALGTFNQSLAETYFFSSPPKLSPGDSESLYAPLMELLSRRSGKSFVYVRPDSWFRYQNDMRKNRFHLLLDEPHFASWRIAFLGHAPLARTEQRIRYVVIARKDGRVYSKEDLVARSICADPPPDLGTLSILQKFAGPFRLPYTMVTYNPLGRVQRLLTGDCAAAILTRHYYTRSPELRGVSHRLKIVTQSESYPGLTFTIAPGVSADVTDAVRGVLVSREAGQATMALRQRIAGGDDFVEANIEEYAGLDELLQGYPGFAR